MKKLTLIMTMLIALTFAMSNVSAIMYSFDWTRTDPLTSASGLELYGKCELTEGDDFSVYVALSVNGVQESFRQYSIANNETVLIKKFPASMFDAYDVIDLGIFCQSTETYGQGYPTTLRKDEFGIVVEPALKVSHRPTTNDPVLNFTYSPTNTTISIELLNKDNISGNTKAIQSPIGLTTDIDTITVNEGYVKWSYDLLLPNPKWVAVNRITSTDGVSDYTGDYKFQLGDIGIVDYSDAVLEGFNVTLEINDGMQNISGNLTYNESLNYVDIIMFKDDYGGVSVLRIDPAVCVPDWIPSAYGSCQVNDSKQATSYIDTNDCGLVFNGTYDWYECDYCTPEWSCGDLSTTECENSNYKCNNVSDSNSCYATTGLASDDFSGDLSDYNSGYCNTYESEDMPNIAIDFLGNFGVQIVALIGLVALVGLYAWGRKRLK